MEVEADAYDSIIVDAWPFHFCIPLPYILASPSALSINNAAHLNEHSTLVM
jgi:hypothetical protein